MKSNEIKLKDLRQEMTAINANILQEITHFFKISKEIGKQKDIMGLPHFDPVRESKMLIDVQMLNKGKISQDIIQHIFKELFKASVDDMHNQTRQKLHVNRINSSKDLIIDVNGIKIGGKNPVIIAGPCAVESYDQIYETAKMLKKSGINILRGGAFKPRSSPYSFQGLGIQALKWLRKCADEFGMSVITEVMDTEAVEIVEKYTDILQVGTRNMHNYSLLKKIGKCSKPVFLKRGLMSTIDEFIFAAEYIYIGGNSQIILCERGIRTFESQTRNTLDISAVPILKKETILPVFIDVSHSTGRKDIVNSMAHAALAAGADGIMVESHINPASALSDANQQLNPEEIKDLISSLSQYFQLL